LIKKLLIAIAASAAVWASSSPAASKSTLQPAWPKTPQQLPSAPAAPSLPPTPSLPATPPQASTPPSSAEPPAAAAPSSLTAPASLRTTYGAQEHVRIGDSPAIQITADLDAAARQSLVYATGISYFMKEGDLWVSFVLDNGSVLPGNRTMLKRKVLKDQHVRERGGGVGHVPLVAIDICIGTVTLPIQVAVKPRSGYVSPLRLSRQDIDRLGGVDPSLKFTGPPECAAPAAAAAQAD
jgi:hypothetical protein